jgi:hypothetical protein
MRLHRALVRDAGRGGTGSVRRRGRPTGGGERAVRRRPPVERVRWRHRRSRRGAERIGGLLGRLPLDRRRRQGEKDERMEHLEDEQHTEIARIPE